MREEVVWLRVSTTACTISHMGLSNPEGVCWAYNLEVDGHGLLVGPGASVLVGIFSSFLLRPLSWIEGFWGFITELGPTAAVGVDTVNLMMRVEPACPPYL